MRGYNLKYYKYIINKQQSCKHTVCESYTVNSFETFNAGWTSIDMCLNVNHVSAPPKLCYSLALSVTSLTTSITCAKADSEYKSFGSLKTFKAKLA